MSHPWQWRGAGLSAIDSGMKLAPYPTLFVSLRHDRLLFALVGSLLLMLHALQPLAAAGMSRGGHFPICTLYGIDDPGASGEAPAGSFDDCPACLSAACSGLTAGKAVLATAAAFPTPARLVFIAPRAGLQSGPVGRQGEPLPAIRAPPLSA